MTGTSLNTVNTEQAGAVLEKVVIEGDLAKLAPADRVSYYREVCNSVGLNPLTRPFDYIKLNGKLTLYAKRDAADQLRQLHGVSVKVLSKEEVDGLYIVHVAAQDKSGRHDEDMGAVQIAGLRGEAKANAIAKAMTKAKRRVTLSICGLGWVSEEEVKDISGAESPKQKLDELFPFETLDATKNDPQGLPESAQLEEPEGDTPSETIDDAPEPLKPSTGAYPLKLGQEVYEMDTAEEFFAEYLKQIKSMAENAEAGTARQRMSFIKALEKDNAETLSTLPEKGRKKLESWRLKLNRQLGPQIENEEPDDA